MINLNWLQSLQAIAHTGSFTRAAAQLGLTQAAVSQHIRQLEDNYGGVVLRTARPLILTPTGQLLLRYADEITAANECLQQRLQANDSLKGDVGLVTPGSSGLLLYAHLLALQVRQPGLIIRHRFAPGAEVQQAVLDNSYHLGLLTFKPDDPRLHAEEIAEEPLELVYPAGSRISSWQDLQQLGFINHPDGKAMATRLLSRHFPGNPGVATLPCKGYSNQVSLLLQPVALGLGFTVVPRYARQAFAAQQQIAVLQCGQPVIDKLWAIYRAEWPLNARCRLVLEQIRATLNQAAASQTR